MKGMVDEQMRANWTGTPKIVYLRFQRLASGCNEAEYTVLRVLGHCRMPGSGHSGVIGLMDGAETAGCGVLFAGCGRFHITP